MKAIHLSPLGDAAGALALAGVMSLALAPSADAAPPRDGTGHGRPVQDTPDPSPLPTGGTPMPGGDDDGGAIGGDPEPDPGVPPEMIELTGTVRDFRESSHPEGHPDFERAPDHGFGLYCGNVAPEISEDGKPVFTGGGAKLWYQFRDSNDVPICYTLYDPDLGDVEGTYGPADHGSIQSSDSFSQWYDDVPGINMSRPLTITMHRQDDGSYVFDDELDPAFDMLGGFFPIESDLFGNPGGSPDRNFHFTYELHADFEYDETANNYFQFIGDDDVFVFIDGRLVIDLGGVHNATEQFVDVSRLDLTHGETYRLDFFFAERHRTFSNFRIVTTLLLQTA
ncbi:MAG: fibro-slime domain-containing protein, partial [Planctomycetota bacterium]